MNSKKLMGMALLLATLSGQSYATSAIPVPSDSKTNYINVPRIANEHNYRIEFTVGKTMSVDTCNGTGLVATIHKLHIKQWPYQYYKVADSGRRISTMMICPNRKKVNKFLSVGKPITVRYNSDSPIIVVAPKKFLIKYKIIRKPTGQPQPCAMKVKYKVTKNQTHH